MLNAMVRSPPVSAPVIGSTPIGDLKRPESFSPSCVSVILTVFVPCGD
jgi:hypothetical protein